MKPSAHRATRAPLPAFVLSILLFAVSCTPWPGAVRPPAEDKAGLRPVASELELPTIQAADAGASTEPAAIRLPLALYILDDTQAQRSSARTATQLRSVFERVNAIWAPAAIIIDLQSIERVATPPAYLDAIERGDFDAYFAGIGRDFDLPAPSLLNAFYARDIGGPNGIQPAGSRALFVMDTPSVLDERVTAHEVGHLLGLHHTLADRGRLMYSGTNGMSLTPEEISVARYVAQGLLAGVR